VSVEERLVRRTGRIAFAQVTVADESRLPFDRAEALIASLQPGTSIERYNRRWRMGRIEHLPGALVTGRIGYEATAGTAELWNEQLADFEETTILQGRTSPFVINLPSARAAFQLRGSDIRPRTFTGNFQALLNEASPMYRWRVVEEIIHIPWTEWRTSVQRITELRLKLLRPNPNYGGRQQVEKLIEEINAEMVNMILRADAESLDGLDIDAGFVQEAIEHVQAGYGAYASYGEVEEEGETQPTAWYSDQEGTPVQKTTEVDPSTGEVSRASLAEAVLEDGTTERATNVTPSVDSGLGSSRVETAKGAQARPNRLDQERAQDGHLDDAMMETDADDLDSEG
jgi:hypothetical protein